MYGGYMAGFMPNVGPLVLLAGTSEAILIAKQALGPACSYRIAHSVDDAISKLSRDVDLIVCNVAFDSSRMFDFVHATRLSQSGRAVPIICFRHHKRPLSEVAHHAIELSVQQFDRTSFVDLYSLSQQGGVATALSALKEAALKEIP